MALKGERQIIAEVATFRMNETAERGYFVMLDPSNEGFVKKVDTTVNANTQVLGCLLNDVVTDESDSRPANYQKAFEVWAGGAVPVLQIGRIYTNVVHPSLSINPGDPAYVNQSGVLVPSGSLDGYTYPLVGRFETGKDSDGYVKVWINC
ncbi:MAG: hypothetical protein DRP85_00745 [Candidatus Makaraimicrobium thalassicum]|nr:MAG: hypothetical protein DRP85_00745 [Candidatus Omnitrophota bacterium]